VSEVHAYNLGCRCPVCLKSRADRGFIYYHQNGGKEHEAEYKKLHIDRDRPLANARNAKRRTSIKNGSVNLTPEEKLRIQEIYIKCKLISESTGIPHQVDHIIPVAKGGLHHPDNLQILTRFENLSKGAKIL
jgi:5-methylcytosine-specific restriction endonuclease McrA